MAAVLKYIKTITDLKRVMQCAPHRCQAVSLTTHLIVGSATLFFFFNLRLRMLSISMNYRFVICVSSADHHGDMGKRIIQEIILRKKSSVEFLFSNSVKSRGLHSIERLVHCYSVPLVKALSRKYAVLLKKI